MQNIGSIMFEYATRTKLRFPSTRGDLTVEQLWDVPLLARDGFDLDSIAKTAYKALELTGVSFVSTERTPAHTKAENILDIIKYVIQVKKDEEVTAKKRASARAEKEKLLQILAEKQDGKLSELSIEDLQQRIAALDV